MVMYNYIVNPKTNRKVRVDTQLGKNILKNYIMEGGEPLPKFLTGWMRKPSKPTTMHFLNTTKGQALLKDLEAAGIKLTRNMTNNPKFEELVKLLAEKGVKDKSGNIVSPETWEADWNTKKEKYEKKLLPVKEAKKELDSLLRSAFEDGLLTMDESRRRSEADTRAKDLKNALETYTKSIDKFSKHYPTNTIKNITLISKVTKAMKQLEELANPQEKSPSPKRKSPPKKKSSSKKLSSRTRKTSPSRITAKKTQPIVMGELRAKQKRPNKGKGHLMTGH